MFGGSIVVGDNLSPTLTDKPRSSAPGIHRGAGPPDGDSVHSVHLANGRVASKNLLRVLGHSILPRYLSHHGRQEAQQPVAPPKPLGQGANVNSELKLSATFLGVTIATLRRSFASTLIHARVRRSLAHRTLYEV